MKAVILAAGKGTRMRHLTQDQPKPMIEVGKQRILEQIVSAIQSTGVREFVVVTGYHANLIEDHFQDGRAFGISVKYVRQTELDGTGGALRVTRAAVGDEPFFLTFGDVITSLENYQRIVDDYERDPVAAVVGVNEIDDPSAGAAVYFDEDTLRVSEIVEKPPKGTSSSNWNNSGLFVFDTSIYDCVDRIELSPRGEYELPDAIRLSIELGDLVRAMKLGGFWGDIGTPEDVERFRTLIETRGDLLDDMSQRVNLRES